MSHAILTKVLSYTEHKPTRIKAYDGAGNSCILSLTNLPYASHDERAHKIAAEKLRDKMEWQGELVGGWTKDGYAFTFSEPKPDNRLVGASGPTNARENIIPLIRFLRQVGDDIVKGKLSLNPPANVIGLADAKHYVEQYFQIKY